MAISFLNDITFNGILFESFFSTFVSFLLCRRYIVCINVYFIYAITHAWIFNFNIQTVFNSAVYRLRWQWWMGRWEVVGKCRNIIEQTIKTKITNTVAMHLHQSWKYSVDFILFCFNIVLWNLCSVFGVRCVCVCVLFGQKKAGYLSFLLLSFY